MKFDLNRVKDLPNLTFAENWCNSSGNRSIAEIAKKEEKSSIVVPTVD